MAARCVRGLGARAHRWHFSFLQRALAPLKGARAANARAHTDCKVLDVVAPGAQTAARHVRRSTALDAHRTRGEGAPSTMMAGAVRAEAPIAARAGDASTFAS